MVGSTLRTEVAIQDNAVTLIGDLTIPNGATAIIVFAHSEGSSRHSSRNKYLAERLNRSGFATLLIDLFTYEEDQEENEEKEDQPPMDEQSGMERLSTRLCCAVDWLSFNPDTEYLAIGLFGSGTGSAAALICAAKRRLKVAAIVARGGRPDLANEALAYVLCPTLFLVGGFDPQVMAMNEKALHLMQCHREIEIIPGATHSFKEPGRLDLVASMSTWWFARYCTTQFGPHREAGQTVDGINPHSLEPVDRFDGSLRTH